MNKTEAAEKVAKLQRLAEGTKSKAEADSARKNAKKIAEEHGLSDSDIVLGMKAGAFDDLLDRVNAFGRLRDLPPAVSLAIEMIKKEQGKSDKAALLDKAVNSARFAKVMMGGNETVKLLNSILDDVLKSHKITY